MTRPTLVLLPGLDGTGVMFKPLLPVLAEGTRSVVISYPPDEPLDYEELLPTVLAALPASSPFVLLGESFSGPLALVAAATRPGGLRGLVLCASFIRNPIRWAPSWLGPLIHPSIFRLYPTLKAAKAILGGYSSPTLRSLTEEALRGVRADVLARRVHSVLKVDVTRELAACSAPILYLRGTRDRVVPGYAVETITGVKPSVEVVQIAAPHLVLQCEPRAAAVAINEFLTKIEADD